MNRRRAQFFFRKPLAHEPRPFVIRKQARPQRQPQQFVHQPAQRYPPEPPREQQRHYQDQHRSRVGRV